MEEGGGTGFSFAIQRGASCEGADEEGKVGDGDGEAYPVHHDGREGGFSSFG